MLISLRQPRVTLCVFPSGKVISMGARSEASAIIGCRKVARLIQKIPDYAAVALSDFRIHNVTASGALGYRVDLAAIARHPLHEEQVEYDPGQFPGLRFKLEDDYISPSTAAPVPAVKPEVKPEPASSLAASSAPFSWLQRPTVSAVASSSSSAAASSLTLTLYFSGRFTIVGARDESSVYRHFHRLSRLLFRFAQPNSLPAAVQGGGYDAWLQWAEREERARGRMGWEDEAERVRDEIVRRERRRERLSRQQEAQQAAAVSAGRTELRVKLEPGVKEEQKAETDDKEEKREEKQEDQVMQKEGGGSEEKQQAAAAASMPAAPVVDPAAERKDSDERQQDKRVDGIGVAAGPASLLVSESLMVMEANDGSSAPDDAEAEVEWE